MNLFLKWSATILTIVGALLTALNIYPLNVWVINVGSVLWLIFAVRIKENSLVVVNAGLLVIYMFGAVKTVL